MKFNKLKGESGSAMLLAIFIIALITIIMISFSSQISNQIKSTMNLDENIQEKYNVESKIEEGTADFISNIGINEHKEDWKKQIKDKDGNIIEIPMVYEYYTISYDDTLVKNISINYNGLAMVIGEDIVIDSDQNKNNNNPDSLNQPHGDINSNIDFVIKFEGEDKEISEINITISRILSTNEYDISYDVMFWRIK